MLFLCLGVRLLQQFHIYGLIHVKVQLRSKEYFAFGCGVAICYNTYHGCFHMKLHLMEDMHRD